MCSSFVRARARARDGEVTMADEVVNYSADHVLEYPFVRSVGPVDRRLPDRPARRQGRRDHGERGPGHRAAHRVRPRDGRRDDRRGRGRARRHGDVVVVGGRAARQASAADALRLGAGALRRRRHLVPPRHAGGVTRRGVDRHAGAARVRARGRAGRPRQGHQPLRRRWEVRS